MIDSWISVFKPNADALLDFLLPHIDDGMLLQIAEADYEQDVELHYAPLKLFRDERIVPVLDWHPGEVLGLVRWSEPDEVGWKPGDEGQRGHLLRAFACSTLLRARERRENDTYDSYGDTIVQLERSVQALGTAFLQPGAQFFAWCLAALSELQQVDEERIFFGLALLSLTIKTQNLAAPELTDLCQWITSGNDLAADPGAEWPAHHIRGLNFDRWVEIGYELLNWAESHTESDCDQWVRKIGQSLVAT